MTHVHEDLGAYVLGSLDQGDAERVRAHIDDCPGCAEAYAELSGLPGLLDLAVVASAAEEEPLPPALEERLLDRFARERPPAEPKRRWRPRLFLGVGGALAGAAAAAATLLIVLGFQQPRTLSASYRLALEPVAGAPAAANANVALRSVDSGTVVRMWVHNLPTDKGDVYEVMCDAPGWSASAGTFRVDKKGDAYVVLTTAARRGQYDAIRVVHKSGGQSSNVLDGKLS
jgi:anti-sigma factor RsiW